MTFPFKTAEPDVQDLVLDLALQLVDGFDGSPRLVGDPAVRLAGRPVEPYRKESGATFLFFGLKAGDYTIQVRSLPERPYYLDVDIPVTLPMPDPRQPAYPDPSLADPYKALGDLFMSSPRRLYDQAIEAYEKAVVLRPHYAEAQVGLGDARAAKGDNEGAIAHYQKALSLDPLNARVHFALGKIYYTEKGLYYEAVNSYKKAVDLDPYFLDARMGLGEIYEEKGLYKDAIAEYRKVIETDAKHAGARYNLALAYEKVDPKEAINQWERYIDLASQVATEKEWVDVARQHLKKLREKHPQ